MPPCLQLASAAWVSRASTRPAKSIQQPTLTHPQKSEVKRSLTRFTGKSARSSPPTSGRRGTAFEPAKVVAALLGTAQWLACSPASSLDPSRGPHPAEGCPPSVGLLHLPCWAVHVNPGRHSLSPRQQGDVGPLPAAAAAGVLGLAGLLLGAATQDRAGRGALVGDSPHHHHHAGWYSRHR